MIAYCIKSKQHLTILKTDSSGIIGDHNDIGACIMEYADKENSHQIRLMSQAQEDTAALRITCGGDVVMDCDESDLDSNSSFDGESSNEESL